MRTSLDPSSELFLANLERAQDRLEHAQRQLSSGRRLTSASDAPDDVGSLLQLRAALARNTRLEANMHRARTEANVAEIAMNEVSELLDRASGLATQAANASVSTEMRLSLAAQIKSIQEQVVTLSRTQVEGRFIFSGDLDQGPAYAIDWTSATGVTEIAAVQGTRLLEDPAGGAFVMMRTAREIFDDPAPGGKNVFRTLNTLRLALETDATAVQQALPLLREAAEYIRTQIGFFGPLQNRIEQSTQFAGKYGVELRTAISRLEDADITAAAIEISQANLQIQAGLGAHAQIRRTTLFDILR